MSDPAIEPDTPEETPEPQAEIAAYTLDNFRADPANVEALSQFLSSPAGMALQAAIANESPAVTLGRGIAQTKSTPTATADSYLGMIGGFESLRYKIFTMARQPKGGPRPRMSGKGGAPRIPPEKAPSE